MFQQIAISILVSILAQVGVTSPEVVTYDAQENAGFCVEFDQYHNEACVETRGIIGVYLCNDTKSDDCQVLDLTGIDKPDNKLAKVARLLDCTIDFQTAQPYCYTPGEKETVEGEEYAHKGGQFWKAYNQHVLNLPALFK